MIKSCVKTKSDVKSCRSLKQILCDLQFADPLFIPAWTVA